jgi:hypothetical protein
MRAVSEPGDSKDFRQAEFDRHCEAMTRFAERAGSERQSPLALTMIVRAASSVPAQALILLKEPLVRAGVCAKAILAKIEPEDDLRQLFAGLSELSPGEPPSDLIRWARNPRLLDAHEQVTYGEDMCWSGDHMRRDAEKRNALTLFDEGVPDAVRLGKLAFAALWSASTLVPERRLLGKSAAKPSGAYELAPNAQVAVSPLRPSLQGWPLVRH